MRLTMLGVGSSAGTPLIGCQCDTCTSNNPKNKRTRCSAIITAPTGEVILIDTGPDLRQQALRENLTRVDAVLYTHTHADHLHGIDDLRAFCQLHRKQIPLYAKQDAVTHISTKFAYAIREPSHFWDLPVLSIQEISVPFELFGLHIVPLKVMHGRLEILGFRINDIAYLTDVSEIPEDTLAQLHGIKYLMLDCLRYQAHNTHINVEQSLAYAGRINAEATYLMHMTHEIEYETLSKTLPPRIFLAYDGLTLEF